MSLQDAVRALLAANEAAIELISSEPWQHTQSPEWHQAVATRGSFEADAMGLLAALCDKLDEAESGVFHRKLLERAEKAEAAIERVRALAEYARNSGESVSLRGLFLALREEA